MEKAESLSLDFRDKKKSSKPLFTSHELETIKVLCQIILPSKELYGGIIEAETPNFIESISREFFIIKDVLLTGLFWLDNSSINKFGVDFKIAKQEQQCQILDTIAFQNTEIPLEKQPIEIKFFYVLRGLTLICYYTSKTGIASLGYKGNERNIWNGVPQDVLDEYNMSYDIEWINKCTEQGDRETIAVWDDEGNLLT